MRRRQLLRQRRLRRARPTQVEPAAINRELPANASLVAMSDVGWKHFVVKPESLVAIQKPRATFVLAKMISPLGECVDDITTVGVVRTVCSNGD